MRLFPVTGIPEIHPGDDISTLVNDRVDLEPTDIVAIASTIVSKSESRQAALEEFEPGAKARLIADRLSQISGDEKDPRFAEAVLQESTELVMETPFLLARTPSGHIGVNAGIDRSNTGGAELLLLPRDPHQSARDIREGFPQRNPVIITDTSGRPFRQGQVGVGLGWAGIAACRDWRGEVDRDGRELGVTVEAVVDELAAAANLITGEGAEGTPVAIIRGLDVERWESRDGMYRDEETDFVRAALREWTFDPA